MKQSRIESVHAGLNLVLMFRFIPPPDPPPKRPHPGKHSAAEQGEPQQLQAILIGQTNPYKEDAAKD